MLVLGPTGMTMRIAFLALVVLFGAQVTVAKSGDTQICKWKNCKVAAFSIGGDDSLRSQTTFAIPAMTQRGIHGTWWVNTGRGHNELGFDFIDDEEYWIAAVKAGHDLANHTLHHTGARYDADAEWEIGENTRRIWAIEPDQKILLFERGGGTVWDTSEDNIAQLLKKYRCVDGRGAPGVDSPAWQINHSGADLRGFVDAAIREGSYHYIIFHGIGPKAEWGGQIDGKAFISLLDYLVEKRDVVWSDTFTKIYKYVEEREHSQISTIERSRKRIRLALTASLDTSHGMFDYPITLNTDVPAGWETCTVKQGNSSAVYAVNEGVVQYSALPNGGDITIIPGGSPLPKETRTGLPGLPPSPPEPPVLATKTIDDFSNANRAELNSAWWPLPCGNDSRISLERVAEGRDGMNYVYAAGDKPVSGRLRRNTSLDLSPYRYISLQFKPSNTNDAITFQFMEALQSEFWEFSFIPRSTDTQTVVIPLTTEYFHHPQWFNSADADGVMDLRNIKLVSLFISGDRGGTVRFDRINSIQVAPTSGYLPLREQASTPALTETGRCIPRP